MDISELAVERTGDGAGQQVGRDYPGQMSETAELPHDGRERRGHDGLVQRGEQKRQKQCADDRQKGCSLLLGWCDGALVTAVQEI
jgi:hypothetical protein